MTTVVESLTNATNRVNAAATLMEQIRDQVAANLATTTNNAQTVINNFINRTPYAACFVDFNNGVDAPGRGGDSNPYKTIDYALDVVDGSVTNTIYLLSDHMLNKYHTILNVINFVGIAKIPSGSYGFPYTFTTRKLSFATEAFNSPRNDIGRFVPFFDMQGGALQFRNVDIALPTPAPGVNFKTLIAGGAAPITLLNLTITVDAAGVDIKLIGQPNNQMLVSLGAVVFGPNVPGKIFTGIAAGGDPNSVFAYRSNITSA